MNELINESINHLLSTFRHELHDKFGVGNICTSGLVVANCFTNFRVHTCHLVFRNEKSTVYVKVKVNYTIYNVE